VPGVVGDQQSVAHDTFARGLLDYPQYTRPAEFRGMPVPPVLLSGHHVEIARWRRREALARTLALRPEMLDHASLDATDQALLNELRHTKEMER
jgi:tRNA (guanine37-N1)-methyltransferase